MYSLSRERLLFSFDEDPAMPEGSETPEIISEDNPMKNSAQLCKNSLEKEPVSTCAVNGAHGRGSEARVV